MIVVLTVIAMAFYYIWRATYLTPWYDELYTYYYFISRGPIYSAIHWPLANNHVGYSVLSSLINSFGNSYVGLRGISFLCAVFNPFLVYRLSRRFLEDLYAYCAMLLYFSCMLVNDLSIQGRGYTLACTCFIITFRQLIIICRSEDFKLNDYIALSVAVILGLYTLPSSIYWVFPACLAAAIFLLVNGYRTYDFRDSIWKTRYFKRLKNCIVTAIISGVILLGLYLIIWFAIGANLIVKDEAGAFYGMPHLKLIISHPFMALSKGFTYMITKSTAQGVNRTSYLADFVSWAKALSGLMYPGFAPLSLFVTISVLILFITECIRHFENSRTIFNLMMILSIMGYPIMMIIQAKLPYYKVFSYVGVLIAISYAYVIGHVSAMIRFLLRRHEKASFLLMFLKWVPIIFVLIFSASMMIRPDYHSQYGQRETNCYNALYIAHPSPKKHLCVLDCDQQYLLKFGWNIECENTDVTDCDYILVDRDMMSDDFAGEDSWKFYVTYETIPWDYINSNYYIFYENEDFVLYKR